MPAPADRVLEAVRRALAGWELEIDEAGGWIDTGWGPERPSGRELVFGASGVERVRYNIALRSTPAGTEIRVAADVERRAAGGSRSLRWERQASDGRAELELIRRIREGL